MSNCPCAQTAPNSYPQEGPRGSPVGLLPIPAAPRLVMGQRWPEGSLFQKFVFSFAAFGSRALTQHQIKTHSKRTFLPFPISFSLSDFPREKVSIWYHYFSSTSLTCSSLFLLCYFFFSDRKRAGFRLRAFHAYISPEIDTSAVFVCRVTFPLWLVK